MLEKVYAIVGNWGFSPAPKGITTYAYLPETGELNMIETVFPEIAAGQMCVDQERSIIYVVDECGDRRGEIGGGGYVMAFKLDRDSGKLTLINEKESLCPEPSYLCLDREKKHLLVCHCSDPWHVTKVKRRGDGTYSNEVLFDDTGLVLFRLNDDGSLGEVCDISVTEMSRGKGENSQINVDPVSGHIQLVQVISRLHCIVPSPGRDIFVSCDKGMDCVYTYRVDPDRERLVQLDRFQSRTRVFPRYAAFHPTLPVFYVNNEFDPSMDVLAYDQETGKMTHLGCFSLLFKEVGLVEGKPVGAQDLLVSQDGKTLYCSLVGINCIAVLRLDGEGLPTLVQLVPCGGNMPRALQFSPDGRFMFSGNMLSGNITTLNVLSDGTLAETGRVTQAVSPSAIQFFETAPR